MQYLMIAVAILWVLISLIPSLLAIRYFGELWRLRRKGCLKYLLYAFLATNAKLLTYVLSPVAAALSVLFGWNNLPTGLYWMQTHDDDLDPKYQPSYRPTPTNKFTLWYWRMSWLCRNPAYSFMHNQLGTDSGNGVKSVVIGEGRWALGKEGLERRIYHGTNLEGVQLRGNVVILGRLIYLYLGWKLVRDDKDGKRMLALGVGLN